MGAKVSFTGPFVSESAAPSVVGGSTDEYVVSFDGLDWRSLRTWTAIKM